MPSSARSDKQHLTIGEVADQSGLAASALRFYEREGLIPKANRSAGKRVWSGDVLDRLALIDVAKSAGFTVAEIKMLISGVARRTPPGPRWRQLAERKLVELEERIAEVERMRRVLHAVTRCKCPTLEDRSRALRG